jgi:hypothetical protein
MKIEVILFFVNLLLMNAFKDCNFTNLDFLSVYDIGKQDELNQTFTKIN